MDKPAEPREDFMNLASRFVDGEATDEEMASLRDILRRDPEARRLMARLVHQHGSLQWSSAKPAAILGRRNPTWRQDRPRALRAAAWMAAAAAACVAIALLARPPPPHRGTPAESLRRFEAGRRR